tara:strand:- start:85 stop:396 length:312 start_codon:yes stop_codon:yes gene_type:complete
LSETEILLKAALNRMAIRIKEKLINSAEEFSEIADEIPQRLKDEWSSFKEEVIKESERLENNKTSSKEQNSSQQSKREDLIQSQIDSLRSKVIEINKNIEERN